MSRNRNFFPTGCKEVFELPSQWKLISLGWVLESPVTDGPHSTPQFLEEGVPFLSVDGIQEGSLVFENCRYISREDHTEFKKKAAPKAGDILLGKAASVGKVALVTDSAPEFSIWSPLALIRAIQNKCIAKFLLYCFNSVELQNQIKLLSNSNTQANLGMKDIPKLKLPIPPFDEQQKIAQFLNYETAKIDALIDEQKRLIELLKEKRQAVISHAVTKGLNPNAPMKDSGFEWLGEVPEHWRVKSYKYACRIYRGKFTHRPRNDPKMYDGQHPFIQTGDVARAQKTIETYSQTLNDRGAAVSQKFPAGTLVMAIAANIGDTAILGFEAYAPDSVVGFKPTNDTNLEFLRYSLISALPALEQASTQNTQANLNIDRIGSLVATFPSLDEQERIVKHIEEQLSGASELIKEALKTEKLLKERRSALISAAVTGKIDVRDWQPPAGSDTVDSNASVQTERHYG
ncbi:restriction endonuclease subunit S [Idiomarina sp. Sol25]|nr:restriction endonuclease subunit S [Idiomarina sp. Sol25]MDV6326863.1 restriction endonuclease subunit S [Idiomarina sp. Sol25]